MFVQVRANNPHSDGRSRAGRRFANGQVYRLEVVDDPEGGPPHDARAFAGKDGSPGDKISRAGLALIKSDPVMSWSEGGDVEVQLAGAAFDEARAQIAALAEENAKLTVRAAQLEAENVDLKSKLAEATSKKK